MRPQRRTYMRRLLIILFVKEDRKRGLDVMLSRLSICRERHGPDGVHHEVPRGGMDDRTQILQK